MTTIVSTAAYAAAKALAPAGHIPKRSHLSEVMAAMLGYQTYAALVVEERDASLPHHLGDAELLVLNPPAGELRARKLGVGDVSSVIQACIVALKASVGDIQVYRGLDDFYDSYGRDALAEAVSSSEEVASAMAETNAYFGDDPELPDETPPTENLWEARAGWSIEARGKMHGEHDADGDRMFAGDTLNCYGKLSFVKAGRAGLISADSEGYAGVDDSIRNQDHDDEAAYMESLRHP